MDDKFKFEIHPSVVIQLGEDLISDEIQAVTELIKNSYDADSKYCKVSIDTQWQGVVDKEVQDEPFKGRIVIEDAGCGMDVEGIRMGFFTISDSPKKKLKKQRKTTPGGRTPLGDKGLGRLGVQRLGEYIEIFTQTKNNKSGYHLAFSWLDFHTSSKLSDVKIRSKPFSFNDKKHGTKIIISGLNNIDQWKGADALKRLENELSLMISPYKEIQQFIIYTTIDGKKLELAQLSDNVRNIAHLRYKFTYDGEKLVVKGKARLDYWRPDKKSEIRDYSRLLEEDKGSDFFKYLKKQKKLKSLNLSQSNDKSWYAEYSQQFEINTLDKFEFVEKAGINGIEQNRQIADPGPFFGEIDSFNLGNTAFQNQSVFDRKAEYTNFIKTFSKISVFRDGFAIRVDPDWLNLSKGQTSGGSFYGLRPGNTAGYVSLSAKQNIMLEETTDREGFKKNAYYNNFYLLLTKVIDFANNAQEDLRRKYHEFKDTKSLIEAGELPNQETDIIASAIAKKSKSINVNAEQVKLRLVKANAIIQSESKSDSEHSDALSGEIKDLVNLANEYFENSGGDIASVPHLADALQNRIQSLQDQISSMYEIVALGITAETLAHELFNISDLLSQRAEEMKRKVRVLKKVDSNVLIFIESIQSIAISLRKQISYLSPALRYVREKKEKINFYDFLVETRDFNKERYEKKNISFNIILPNKNDNFIVKMNKGKLIQIIENFILNSEYWLLEDIRQKRIKKGQINFEIDSPLLRIWDNGIGIDPNIEFSLFDPFVTTKAKEKGRGLGLFIVEQLLDSVGCSVGLLPQKNNSNRLYKFQLNLQGAVSD